MLHFVFVVFCCGFVTILFSDNYNYRNNCEYYSKILVLVNPGDLNNFVGSIIMVYNILHINDGYVAS